MDIKFISYDYDEHSLCLGVLTVTINGKEYRFGHGVNSFDYETGKYTDGNYDDFWRSGGSLDESYVEDDSWILDYEERKYPKWMLPLFPRLIEIFNKNVPHGCCGGCL